MKRGPHPDGSGVSGWLRRNGMMAAATILAFLLLYIIGFALVAALFD